MPDRDRRLSIDDSEHAAVEHDLVDLTNEVEDARGPVDFYQITQVRPSLAGNTARSQSLLRHSDDQARLCRLGNGTIVRPGDFVELQCPEHRKVDVESSGDFLRIVKILKDADNGDVTLRGLRYMREKYLVGKDSDNKGPKLNEIVMHLTVREDDPRPAEVQGLEDIPLSEIERKQQIVVTDMSYPYKGFHYQPSAFFAPIAGKSKDQQRLYIFKKGPLLSRQSSVQRNSTPQNATHVPSKTSIEGLDSREHRRNPSFEEVSTPRMLRRSLPFQRGRLTMFDMFCGNGGASRGADQAGLEVLGGLDHNELAMKGWELNNSDAIPLCMDSFEFLRNDNWRIIGRGRCDILNISNPCQPYSGAHTWKGQNDEINIEQLQVIKPLIELLKPRIVVLENTAGLANIKKHRPYFNKVLNDIKSAGAGYNLRYNIINMADYGLPQERKRLIIIAARKELPLPPFPKPTHGPPGSGLKPYVSIGEALRVLDRLSKRTVERDSYHKPHKEVPRREQAYDPFTKFVDCIVTGGVTSPHWSGEKFTPRELALLQSLPYYHHLTGSWSQAIKQVGNMFPPLMAEQVYRICAQTLEAFDNGFIDADEDIDDLNVTLIEKGVDIPKVSYAPTSLFDMTVDHPPSPYRYLSRPELSDANHVDHSSAWAKRSFGSGVRNERKRCRSFEDMEEDEEETPSSEEPRTKRAATSTRQRFLAERSIESKA
ncbi:hypothetical protein E8E12_011053 [Didymella heteroderae]|uniref:DNA (cytosine-5-)-methyltransferase n=1 Tax=Didymella heteroderae TaxID=1769908 RepID=A0A9P5C574_9PLEO|nr:hypothetical protein E8E12_011053 [Didymella heteroderae]